MKEEVISYQFDNQTFNGFAVFPDHKEKAPAILIAHAWMGQQEFFKEKARALAKLGYVGFCADVYGKLANDIDEAKKLMMPLFNNRPLLLKRIQAAYHTMKSLDGVDQDKLGGIGYCFGGTTILELFKSGVDLKGVVTFHGGLANPEKGPINPIAKEIKGSVLILHGYEDPLVSSNDLQRTLKELEEANIDWQAHIYGHTLHAFTDPKASKPEMGLKYNQLSSERAWLEMKFFFRELFEGDL
ncbi:MAG: hypothetical protein BGO10_00145 [Chlamydia sp. 32-24]|nr:MAG: hypothetical protein BGO10_00145 [Chlamydia sp. 32-24]